MGHLIQIREGHDWLGANWAAEHVVRLILRFLSPTTSLETQHILQSLESESSDIDLSDCSKADFEAILAASEQAFAALTTAGPNSDYFDDPDFYPAFVEQFHKFIEILRTDARATNRNA